MWYNESRKFVVEAVRQHPSTDSKKVSLTMSNTLPHHAHKGKIYTIYALIDPRDQEIRYIGITYDVYARMRQHSRCEGTNTNKNAWIKELQKEQVMFVMHSLEKVKTIGKALEREQYWIKYHLQQGANLTNIAGMPGDDLGKTPKVPGEKKIISPAEAAQIFFRTSVGEIVSIPESSWGDFDVFIKQYVNITAEEKEQEGVWDKAQKRQVLSYLLKNGVQLDLCDAEGEPLNITWDDYAKREQPTEAEYQTAIDSIEDPFAQRVARAIHEKVPGWTL